MKKIMFAVFTAAFVMASAAKAAVNFNNYGNQGLFDLSGQSLYVVDGAQDVVVTFYFEEAGYDNYLRLDQLGLTNIIHNNSATAGDTVNLGSFSSGTILDFSMKTKGHTFFMGDASRNSDNLVHAGVDADFASNEILVGFEDIHGGGDSDYDDLIFSVSNVSVTSPVPEPSTYALMLGGLGLVGFMARRRKQA